ncbi:hypothetical protein JZO76_00260 [Enterococcus sp. MJM12]|uniref:Uncharacterized protein n=1 Tax=Candidatus Enterococcus myersii TaxID=2815322 RepID=A0ABS3H3F4_9ENTE|nr:hypothetical protein [Enterococcus sp. MJM12]MBO0447961.1 hypothetical protein [Enterococcus sp. MJM12]
MADYQWAITLGGAAIGALATLFATRSTNSTTLAKTNNDNAVQLFEQYKMLNEQLQSKVDRLESKLESLQEKYEKEIAFYQKEIERLEDENEMLVSELENLKGGK